MRWITNTLTSSRRTMAAQWGKRTVAENTFLLLLPLLGLVVGLTTVITAHIIAFLQNHFWGSGTDLLTAAEWSPWWWCIVIPLVGGLIVGAIGWGFRVNTRGGGITTIIQGLALKGGVISIREVWPRDWAAVFTISAGGSLGREGAIAMLASALASKIGRRFNLSSQQLRLLVCAAAAAALAAVYNAPIGGSLFALEILMGSFALEVLGPVVVVSVISTLVFRSAMGNLPRFIVPRYELVSGWELIAYLGLGVLTGIVALVFVRAMFGSQDLFEKLPLPRWLKPAIGMTLVGVIGIGWPHVFGNGFEAVNNILSEKLCEPSRVVPLLATILVMKILASALTFGAGGAGGLFTPSLMVGALVGGVYGFGVHALAPQHTADYGAYALIGMGGLLAGTTHAPLTAIMMIFEQTNSYQIVLPLMFVCVISHVTVRLLHSRSMDEESFSRRGITLPRGPEGSVMQSLNVSAIMHSDVESLNQADHFPKVVEYFLKEPHHHVYVTDNEGRFVGAIRLHALKEMLHQTENMAAVIADDLVDKDFIFLLPHQSLADVMEVFWQQHCERLPVADNVADRKLIGWISKRDLFGVYSQEILRKRQKLARFSTRDATETQENFVELPEGIEIRTVELPAHITGRTLAELAPRSRYKVHVIAVKRRDPLTGRDAMEIPDPNEHLNAGDDLVVIGTFEAIAQFMAALATGVTDG